MAVNSKIFLQACHSFPAPNIHLMACLIHILHIKVGRIMFYNEETGTLVAMLNATGSPGQ